MIDIFNIIKQNLILYYSDYLALRNNSRHVTDNCKYYYIYGAPINVAYLCDSEPFYDEEDKYYIQAHTELEMLIDKVGIEETKTFVNNICNIKVMGCVDAKLMLKQIHQFSTNIDRITAIKDYLRWIGRQCYTHLQYDDNGDITRTTCSRYVAHLEVGTIYKPECYYEEKDKVPEHGVRTTGEEDKN